MADATEELLATEETTELIEEAFSLKVFPNPTADYVTIEVNGALEPNTELTVFDVTGKQVFIDNISSNNYQLAVENYTPGIYLVIIKNGNKSLNQKLIVKKKL